MASRKDNRRVMDMLEKMGMVRKIEDDDAVTEEMKSQEAEGASNIPVQEPHSPSPGRSEVPQAKPEKTYGVSDSVIGKSFWDDDSSSGDRVPDADVFTEAADLYKRFNFRPEGVDTVYLLEEYIRTLPESLPPEMRRSIVLKIVAASGFDFDKLLNDGIDRVSCLNEYSAEFAARTEAVLARYNAEIESLQHQIEGIRETISERKNLHKRQFLEIEGEAQRLKDILDFITK